MTSAKKTQNAKRSKTLLWVVSVGLAIILCCAGIWHLTRNTSIYAPDKEQIRLKVQASLDAANFQASEAYSSLDDTGCDAGNSVGLAWYEHCDFLGQKYFKGQGEIAAALRNADTKLIESGWARDGQTKDYDEVFSGVSDKQLPYQKDGYRMSLVFYADATRNSSYDIKELIDGRKITPLGQDEFLYGVRSNSSYWSCRWDSFFKQPCIAPPVEPTGKSN